MAQLTEDLQYAQLIAKKFGSGGVYRALVSWLILDHNNRERIVALEQEAAGTAHNLENHSNVATPTATGEMLEYNLGTGQWTLIARSTLIDDTPVDGEINAAISSNWAYDHTTGAGLHHDDNIYLDSTDDLDDLNASTDAGMYEWDTTGGNPINAPEASAKHCVMFNLHNGDQMHQMVTGGDGADEPTIWMRRRDGGIWQEWRKVFMANMDTNVLTLPSSIKLHLANGTDVTSSTGGSVSTALTIGVLADDHIQFDGNEIQAWNNTAVEPLHLNLEGGEVRVGDDAWAVNNDYWVRAWRTSTTQSVTANTTTTVVFNNETDPGGNHNTGTGIFTAPIKGWYRLSGQVTLNNTGAAAGSRYLCYVQADTGGGYGNWQTLYNSRGTATGNHSVPFNVSVRLLVGQTARVRINSVNHNGTVVLGSNQTFANFHFIDDYQ